MNDNLYIIVMTPAKAVINISLYLFLVFYSVFLNKNGILWQYCFITLLYHLVVVEGNFPHS